MPANIQANASVQRMRLLHACEDSPQVVQMPNREMVNTTKQETVIYWAPWYPAGDRLDLNHLYAEPKSLYEEVAAKKAPLKMESPDFLRCPATSDLLRSTFVVRAPVDTNASLNFQTRIAKPIDETSADKSKYKVRLDFAHQPTLLNHNLIEYTHPILFFAEDDSMMTTLTAPYFEHVKSYESGVIVPGRFDIGKWFRPMNMEFQLWPGVTTLNIPAGEALCYVQFHTEKRIVLRRFIPNKEMEKLIVSIAQVSPFKKFARLSERYRVFEQSQSKQRVLKLIQKQLI